MPFLWPLSLMEERDLQVFKNKVLRTFQSKKYEVNGILRALYNGVVFY
jgi:hypothetical protein